jgi:hypothetical protein
MQPQIVMSVLVRVEVGKVQPQLTLLVADTPQAHLQTFEPTLPWVEQLVVVPVLMVTGYQIFTGELVG